MESSNMNIVRNTFLSNSVTTHVPCLNEKNTGIHNPAFYILTNKPWTKILRTVFWNTPLLPKAKSDFLPPRKDKVKLK